CTVQLQTAELKQGTTTAPQRYTEATLAADMEAVAKYVTDERIKARLKETSGIGTAATRAAIVEKLKEKGMLAAHGKGKQACLISTEFGRQIVDAVPQILRDAALTAAWEEALDQIARGQYEPEQFMQRTDRMVCSLVRQMQQAAQRNITAQPQSAQRPQPPQARAAAKSAKATTARRSRRASRAHKE
ncbi:MAG: DNA topoisomerase, partial [Rhodocyclaceae bacterium]|nr:DNA topoisomerase [Rhodocyclaceae bacterium]